MMASLAMHLQPLLDWLVHTTWHAAVLVCLILLAQRVFARRIDARGRHALWLLLLIRMALPWAPASGLSVHNLLPSSPHIAAPSACDAHPASLGPLGPSGPRVLERPEGHPIVGVRYTPCVLSLVWLAGAAGLAGGIAAAHLQLARVLRHGRPVSDRWILGLLEECQDLIGVRTPVEVIATRQVAGPALCGWLRLRLLMPAATLAERDRRSLRHIFLHELAHLKRHDLLVGHVAALLHVLHWFNPLIALGLRRMRADREMACDEMVLSVLAPEETTAYGRTIVHQIEQLILSRPRWAMAGLCGDQARIRERIAMIALFAKHARRWPGAAIALMTCLACVGLTEGLTPEPPGLHGPDRVLPTTHQDDHANIIRVYIRHEETGKYLTADGATVRCDADEPGEAGLWEARFDQDLGNPNHRVFLYSTAANRYLTCDERGNPALDRLGPDPAGRWIVWARPQGVWIISEAFEDGYLRLDGRGQVRAVDFGRDARSFWDVDQVWRVKTSDDPLSSPQWRRQHVPGPD